MPTTRDRVFDRLIVDHLVRGTTRVSWGVFYQFLDEGSWHFQLQVGQTGDPQADDWANVGLPVVDGFYAVDDALRDRGTTRQVHYRVILSTDAGTYPSPPAAAFGILDRHDWCLAREIVRKELLRSRLATVPGWLLKRRRQGPTLPKQQAEDPRTMVVDPLTGDIIRRNGPAAQATKGTEFLGGYYAPVPFSFDVTNPAFFDAVDPDMAGNSNPDAVQNSGRAILFPTPAYRDVFVASGSDLRYELGRTTVNAAWRGVPLVGDVALALVPFSDVVYTIPVPGAS